MDRYNETDIASFMPSIRHLLSLLLLAIAPMLPLGSACAQEAEAAEPITIEADSLSYDDVRQVSLFKGRVVLTRGAIVIRGEQVEVRQDPEGYQFGIVTGAPGQPAVFRQDRGGQDEYIEAEAERVEYDGRIDAFRFRTQARLRRWRAGVLVDEVTGNLIQYNNRTDVFTVDGGTFQPGEPRGRVRAMLTPGKDRSTAPRPPQPAGTQAEGGK